MVSRMVLNTISYHGHGALQNAPEGCEGMALSVEDIGAMGEAESAFADVCCPGKPRDTSVEEIKELCRSLF